MLSSTADHLYWMARYVERAENTARMLDTNLQTSLMSPLGSQPDEIWSAMLNLSELKEQFHAKHEQVSSRNVLDFMVCDTSNLSSIYCCLRAARENARAVRGALTTELWETYNYTWLELNALLDDGLHEKAPGEFFEWVKFRSHLSRGVLIGTMLNDEAFRFARLGTFLERADNTARILDMNYSLPSQGYTLAETDSELQDSLPRDFYHWASLLRSVSAFENYRKVYRHGITPERVAELLILCGDMPRSLRACMAEVESNLNHVANGRSRETQRRAGKLHAELRFGRLDNILQTGLHSFLTDFLERINDLGSRIHYEFLTGQHATH
ncbi:MAG TPA: alpha-E domain-containing protein [Chromobacteriaceae bacterium]|nr:alpha-E domain-containing protein [Chromobacteriaceae bacterium]